MNNMNNRFAGQPKTSFILNLNHVDNTIEELSDVIDLNKNRHWMEAKSKLKVFSQKLNDLVTESKEKEVQTENKCVHQSSSHLDHCRSSIDLHESNLDLCRSNLKSSIRPM